MKERGRLIVISGPSGVGKSTITKRVADKLGAVISVSATTRQASEKEENGRDYYFLSREEFERLIREGKLLEYAEYMGNYYGTLSEVVESHLSSGKDVILEIEVQGGKQVDKKFSDVIMIYLLPPSDDELMERLKGRGRDDEETIRRRFENAQMEIKEAKESGVYKYWVVNDSLDRAVEEIIGIIEKEKRGEHNNDRSTER